MGGIDGLPKLLALALGHTLELAGKFPVCGSSGFSKPRVASFALHPHHQVLAEHTVFGFETVAPFLQEPSAVGWVLMHYLSKLLPLLCFSEQNGLLTQLLEGHLLEGLLLVFLILEGTDGIESGH